MGLYQNIYNNIVEILFGTVPLQPWQLTVSSFLAFFLIAYFILFMFKIILSLVWWR